jgi:hypothetical protein
MSSAVELWPGFAASLDGCVSFSREGAELGPHAPLSQVVTPNRGKTQACRMNHRTRMPAGIKKSIDLLSRRGVLIVMILRIARKL